MAVDLLCIWMTIACTSCACHVVAVRCGDRISLTVGVVQKHYRAAQAVSARVSVGCSTGLLHLQSLGAHEQGAHAALTPLRSTPFGEFIVLEARRIGWQSPGVGWQQALMRNSNAAAAILRQSARHELRPSCVFEALSVQTPVMQRSSLGCPRTSISALAPVLRHQLSGSRCRSCCRPCQRQLPKSAPAVQSPLLWPPSALLRCWPALPLVPSAGRVWERRAGMAHHRAPRRAVWPASVICTGAGHKT